MTASSPTGVPVPPGYVLAPRRNWKPIGGALKMIALTIEGIGIVVSALSLGYLTSTFSGIAIGPPPLTSFLNTLEAGVLLAGIGVIVLGVAFFIESLS